ncbi:MAG: nicotinate phosphoribosyltransferase [Rhodothermales bacterium]|nr:nicotinate phosphoribosyltransferase [Rhodothermales bacterium]
MPDIPAPAERSALATDLYQLTMMQAYAAEGLTADATFSLFVRRLPPERNVLLACGLGPALDYLEALHFTDADLRYLAGLDAFTSGFLDGLRDFRFTGSVRALPEGTPCFALEPLLEVTAPLPEAQLVETFLLNQLTFGTLAASKASRVVAAARGRAVVDFGMRRTHGTDAAVKAARAFAVAGVTATSNVAAGRAYDLPVAGTMAHSYVEAHASEMDAFRAFARLYPETTLLVDTYDTLEGVENVIRLAGEVGDAFRVRAIRLDSGDLAALAGDARRRLDAAGLTGVQIFASGGLDEWEVQDLLAQHAPIDGFGVGTRMGTSADAPTLETVYKLAAYAGSGRMKLSERKATLPGPKQVFRRYEGGTAAGDTIGLADEALDGEPLLVEVMRDGARTDAGRESLDTMRARAERERARLPERLLRLEPVEPYPVTVSDRLAGERDRLRVELRARHGLD